MFRLRSADRGALRTLLAGTLALLLTVPTFATAAERSTNDGVFTTEQAAKGAEAHVDYCAKCHHQSYYSGGFLDPWYGASMESLYELVRMKMPEDRPGALRPREYAALLAWVLELNGFPAGDEPLGNTAEALRAVRIERPAP